MAPSRSSRRPRPAAGRAGRTKLDPESLATRLARGLVLAGTFASLAVLVHLDFRGPPLGFGPPERMTSLDEVVYRGGFWGRWVLEVAARGAAPAFIAGYEKQDRIIPSRCPTGNVLMQFPDFPNPNSITTYYYRTVYSLYPRRVYVLPDSTIVSDGRDVVGKVFRPDAPWMREHDVRSVVTWRQDPRGGPDLVDIRGVGEPRGGPPGPAEERGGPRP